MMTGFIFLVHISLLQHCKFTENSLGQLNLLIIDFSNELKYKNI